MQKKYFTRGLLIGMSLLWFSGCANIVEAPKKSDPQVLPSITSTVTGERHQGKFVWHKHKNEDEMFYVIEGTLCFEIENEEPFSMSKGDLFIVTKGINHRVSSEEECKIMLIENKTTEHTGDVKTTITRSIEDQL